MNESQPLTPPVDPEIQEMMARGVHRGHSKSRRHPAMEPYLWGTRNAIEIIDLVKTREKLTEALEFLKELSARKGVLLLVGTAPAAKRALLEVAREFSYPVVTERWIGGTLTNFKVILKRVQRLEELEREQAAGTLEKYTKKEQVRLGKELERLKKTFNGLRPMKQLPDALCIVSLAKDGAALREAKRMGIPVVALADTNTDPRPVTYPIPANDDARPAIEYMLGRITVAFREGLARAESLPEAQVSSPPPQSEGKKAREAERTAND